MTNKNKGEELMYKLVINGEVYVKESSIEKEAKLAVSTEGLPFCCIRTYSAGVHCGYVKSRNGKEVELVNAIRVWSWTGAASLSELATTGSTNVEGCKYAVTVPHIILTEAIEIIDMTEEAKEQMEGAKRWQMKK